MRPTHSTSKTSTEAGFTLIELLVVMVILGLLAAIAIPAFFNQRDKATDAEAKAAVRSAETAMETFATDNDGKYVFANGANAGNPPAAADLVNIEETLADADLQDPVVPAPGDPVAGPESYEVTVLSGTDTDFNIIRHSDGTTELICGDVTGEGNAGCPTGGVWG
jgi:type IV pilus assembly protein PilA